MSANRRAVLGLLGVALAGCASESPITGNSPASSPSPSDSTATASEYDIPPVPDPSDAALDRWCDPASGVAESQLSVLGEALGADESVVKVGFTGDGELRTDAPEVVLSGVIDDSYVGENAYLSGVAFADAELTIAVEYGYPPETGETSTTTQVGMEMGVRYTARVSMDGGFPETVLVRHHGDVVAEVDGPC
ncbi:MAG: hypothetical protein V5A38_09465 [Halolamina sp.]|uniref:hypothetical protein n=1 Tax=Halolamina sp. TaxID=1940283 RepID=UPI002FC27B3E